MFFPNSENFCHCAASVEMETDNSVSCGNKLTPLLVSSRLELPDNNRHPPAARATSKLAAPTPTTTRLICCCFLLAMGCLDFWLGILLGISISLNVRAVGSQEFDLAKILSLMLSQEVFPIPYSLTSARNLMPPDGDRNCHYRTDNCINNIDKFVTEPVDF